MMIWACLNIEITTGLTKEWEVIRSPASLIEILTTENSENAQCLFRGFPDFQKAKEKQPAVIVKRMRLYLGVLIFT